MKEITIRKGGERIGTVECLENHTYITSGMVGENTYFTLQDLILGLQGFDIAMDDLFF